MRPKSRTALSGLIALLLYSQNRAEEPMQRNNTTLLQTRLETVEQWGSRRTGNAAHKACIEWIAAEFQKIGLTVFRDEHRFSLYNLSEENIALSVKSKHGTFSLTPSAAYPFSGLTNKKGVSGRLVALSGKQYRKSKGKIAVVEVPHKTVPTNALFDIHTEYPADAAILPEDIYNPVLSATLFGPDLTGFRKAGALGVIAVWQNMSPGMAAGQYLPFTFPYRDLPATWMAGEDGVAITEAAEEGLTATLVMDGSLDTTVTADNIWTMIDGKKKDETILIISHSDGTNPVEENGFIGLLTLAGRFFQSGEQPERTLVFAVVAGHLRLPDITRRSKEQATTVWLNEHPELWDGKKGHRKAVAGIVLEHLGAMEWADSDNGYTPSGQPEIEVVYATTGKMRDMVRHHWERRTVPFRASIVTPRSIRHLGEGEPLYEAGIPAAALLGIPSYLLSETRSRAPGITRDKLHTLTNAALVEDQCTAVYHLLKDCMNVPSGEFGKVKHVGLFGRIADIGKVIKAMHAK